jgi:hypothetical protein
MGRTGNRGRRESFINVVLRAEEGGCRTRFDDRKEGGPVAAPRRFGRGGTAPLARGRLFAADRRVVVKTRWSGVMGGPSARRRRRPPSPTSSATGHPGWGEGLHFGATGDRTDAVALARRSLNDQHRFRFVVTPEDAAEMTDLRAFTRRWRAISAPGWTGSASPIGTPTTRMRISWCVASQMTVPISSSHAITSHGLRSRAEDLVAAQLGPGPSMKSAPLSGGRWKESAGLASTRRSGRAMTSASSTCGRTIRASTIRRRAVSQSAGCRSWRAWVSPRLQGQVNR